MDANEKLIIREFAGGNKAYRDEAISIYRRHISANGLCHGDPYCDFMSEVDNPCPDLGLRARYREAVLKEPAIVNGGPR
jgi:hypothetical protein